jgi:CRP-like cAMP-binding protein
MPNGNGLLKIPNAPSPTLVRQSNFFTSLPQELLSGMAAQFRLEKWPRNTFVDPNILTQRFHILLDGQLEIKRSNPDTGREVTLDILYSGDNFDVISLLDKRPHDVILSPLRTLKITSVPIETMRKWLWTYPELNKQFLPYLARKMREQEDLITNVALHDVSTRLSRILLKHINKIQCYSGKADREHEAHLINGLSDEVLGRMVGSVRQVVNKQLQHWKSQGILNKKRNQLMINDLEALEREAKCIGGNSNAPRSNYYHPQTP